MQTRVCPCVCLRFLLSPKTPGFGSRSPGPDSARVRQRRAATKSPDSCLPFSPSSVHTTATSRPEQKVPASRKRLRDRGQRCTAVCRPPREDQSSRHPESVPVPPRPGGAGSHSLFPTHLGCHPRTARRWNRGDLSPGARLPSRSVLSFGLTEMPLIYNTAPISVRQSDSATHRHTFFFYILSHCGLSKEVGQSSRGLQQGLVVYSF